MKFKAVPFLLLLLFSCKGTGSTYDPIVENKDERYYRDLKYCQELSEQKRYLDGQTGNAALAGGAVGALIGTGSGLEGAAAGALIGGIAGAGTRVFVANQDKEYIIVQCLRQRGYNVIM